MLAMVIWIDRNLATPRRHVMCMSQTDRQKIDADKFASHRRDIVVSNSLNRDQGVPRFRLWWALRGAAIHYTYVTLWPRDQRDALFNQLTSEMRDYPGRD